MTKIKAKQIKETPLKKQILQVSQLVGMINKIPTRKNLRQQMDVLSERIESIEEINYRMEKQFTNQLEKKTGVKKLRSQVRLLAKKADAIRVADKKQAFDLVTKIILDGPKPEYIQAIKKLMQIGE